MDLPPPPPSFPSLLPLLPSISPAFAKPPYSSCYTKEKKINSKEEAEFSFELK